MRKWTYLVAALLMAGATTTFTGCIDNDEPAGIENLRGAKAELLKAKAAVELADAAYRNAETQLKLVEIEKEKLIVEAQKLENELAAATNEAEIAKIKADLEKNKLTWEQELLREKETLAYAQKAYDDAMKALELSKTYLSEAELKQLKAVQDGWDIAKGAMDDAKTDLESAYDAYKDIVIAAKNYINEATLQEALLNAQATFDKASNKLTIKKEALKALESNDAYNAWIALKAKYNAKIDSLNSVLANKKTAEAKIIAENTNGTIKNLQGAIKAIDDVIANKKDVAGKADSTYTVSEAIKTNIDNTKFAGFVAYDNGTGVVTAKFNATAAVLALVKTNTPDKADNTSDAAEYATLMDNTYGFAEGKNSAYAAAVKNIDDAIKSVNDSKAAIDANEVAYAKEIQAAAKKKMDDSKKAAETLIAAWEKAVADYNSSTEFTKAEYDEAYGGIEKLLTNISDTDKDLVYTKYMAFRATMQANGQTNATLPSAITNGATLKTWLDTAGNNKTALLPASFTAVNKKQLLLEAAKLAFGDAGVYDGKGVLVRPTDDQIKKLGYVNGGAQGAYLAAVVAYNTATENVEKAIQFDKVIAQLNAWKSSLSAAKTAYVAKHQTTIDGVTNTQKAVAEKVANPIKALGIAAVEAMKADIKLVIDAIDGKEIAEYETIIDALKAEIGDKKGVDGKTTSTGLNLDVENASEAVLNAEKMIELFKAGNLKEQYVIEWAKKDLDLAKATYASKVSIFNYWSGKLDDMMKALYGKASAQ